MEGEEKEMGIDTYFYITHDDMGYYCSDWKYRELGTFEEHYMLGRDKEEFL
jgi:hypothetical protein